MTSLDSQEIQTEKKVYPTTHKFGWALRVGDKIKVWWGTGDCIMPILSLEDYDNPAKEMFKMGCRKAKFSDGRDLTIGNDETLEIYGVDETIAGKQPKTNLQKQMGQRKRFFKCLGKNLQVGDIINVLWKNGGDEILKLEPYIGQLMDFFPNGAQEATFLNKEETFPLDNNKEYEVLFRMGAREKKNLKAQGVDSEYYPEDIMSALDEDFNRMYGDYESVVNIESAPFNSRSDSINYYDEKDDGDESSNRRIIGFAAGITQTPRVKRVVEVTKFEA